jgi:hypothetical protein
VGFGRRKPPVARLRQRRRGRHGQEHHRYLRGQFEAAFDVAQQVVRNDPAFIAEWTLPKLIEAALRAARPDAASAFAVLVGRASTAGTAVGARRACTLPCAADRRQRCRGRNVEAIRQLGRSRAALDAARAHRLYASGAASLALRTPCSRI